MKQLLMVPAVVDEEDADPDYYTLDGLTAWYRVLQYNTHDSEDALEWRWFMRFYARDRQLLQQWEAEVLPHLDSKVWAIKHKKYPRAQVKKHRDGWIVLFHRAPPEVTYEEGAFIGSFWRHSSAIHFAHDYIGTYRGR